MCDTDLKPGSQYLSQNVVIKVYNPLLSKIKIKSSNISSFFYITTILTCNTDLKPKTILY